MSKIRHRCWSYLLPALLMMALSTPVFADSLRCGSGLVRDGDARARVLRLCGEPTDVETRSILRRPHFLRSGRLWYFGHDHVAVPVELWTYNLGPNKFMRRLKIVDGIVEEIETLGYGYYD